MSSEIATQALPQLALGEGGKYGQPPLCPLSSRVPFASSQRAKWLVEPRIPRGNSIRSGEWDI
jgi:hypothetical protein